MRDITIDFSDVRNKLDIMRIVLSPRQMDLMLERALRRTSSHVKTILKRDLPKQYNVRPSWVASHVGAPQINTHAGLNVRCSIPIEGKRGTIGGRYKAQGGAHGWKSAHRKRYKITAGIVKGKRSELPEKMKHQGNNPPFRNLSAKKLNKVAFVRVGKERTPIVPVVGVAVPQMPLNRSRREVEADIRKMLMKRIDHEFDYMMGRCEKR